MKHQAKRGSGPGARNGLREPSLLERAGLGLYSLLQRGLRRLHLRRCLYIWGQRCLAARPEQLRLALRTLRGMRVRESGVEAIDDLLAVRPGARADFLRRFQRGDRCLSVYNGERCVAFLWSCSGPCDRENSFGARWRIPEKALWLYDLQSDAGQLGAIAYLNFYLREEAAIRGVEWLLGQADWCNHRSRWSHQSLGYRETGTVVSLQLAGLHLHLTVPEGPGSWRLQWGAAAIDTGALAAGAWPAPAPAETGKPDREAESTVRRSELAMPDVGADRQGGEPAGGQPESRQSPEQVLSQQLPPQDLSLGQPQASAVPKSGEQVPLGRAAAAPDGHEAGTRSAALVVEQERETSTPAAVAKQASGGFLQAIACDCGASVALRPGELVCGCGRHWGQHRPGLTVLNAAMPYWGELPREQMQTFVTASRAEGWRQALKQHCPPELHDYIQAGQRAHFEQVIDLPRPSRVLELGAGLGAISCELARYHEVVALEGVRERADFMSIRAEQDRLARLHVVCGDLHLTEFVPQQFDLVIMNGVLEWVAINQTGEPRAVQREVLKRIRRWLRPEGRLYVAIENRFGFGAFRGELDHSGLPYTSLMPRPLARWVCNRQARYRSEVNRGYRTYTYSFAGYRRLFREAGFKIHQTYLPFPSYNHYEELIALEREALRFRVQQKAAATRLRGAETLAKQVRRQMLGMPWTWKTLSPAFAFVLEVRNA